MQPRNGANLGMRNNSLYFIPIYNSKYGVKLYTVSGGAGGGREPGRKKPFK